MSGSTIDVTLSAIDRITAPINRIQARIERLTAPLGRVARAIGRIGEASGIARLGSAIGRIGGAVRGVSDEVVRLTGLFAGIGAAALAGLVGLPKMVADTAKEIRVGAQVSGMDPEMFQRVVYATQTVDVTGEQVGDIGKDAREKIGEYKLTGGGEAKDFFEKYGKRYGITANKLLSLTPLEALATIQNTMERAGASVAEQSFILESFANDATKLLPLFENRAARMKALMAEAEQSGSVMSEEDMRRAEEFGNSWRAVSAQIKGIGQEIGVALTGPIGAVIDRIEKWISVNRELVSTKVDEWAGRVGQFIRDIQDPASDLRVRIDDVAASFAGWADRIAPVVDLVGGPLNAVLLSLGAITFGPLIAALASLAGAFVTLGVAILATPVGWFLGAVAAIAGAAYLIYDNWDGLASYFQGVWASVTAAFDDGITNGVMAVLREFMPVTHIARGMQALGEYLAGIDLATEGSRILGSLLQGFAEQFAAFDSWLAGLEAQFFALGVAIVTSIWDGLKSQWSALVEWVRSAFADLTSWMPDWAKSKLGLSASVTSTTEAVTNGIVASAANVATPTVEAATVPPPVAAPNFEVPTGATVSTPSVAVSMPTAPSFALPSAAPPEPGDSTSTSQISAGTVDASSVNVGHFEAPEPFLVHQPQTVNAPATYNVVVNAQGVSKEEVVEAIRRAFAGVEERRRQDNLSALED